MRRCFALKCAPENDRRTSLQKKTLSPLFAPLFLEPAARNSDLQTLHTRIPGT